MKTIQNWFKQYLWWTFIVTKHESKLFLSLRHFRKRTCLQLRCEHKQAWLSISIVGRKQKFRKWEIAQWRSIEKVWVLIAQFYRLFLQTDRSQKSVQWLILRAAKHSWRLCLSRTEKRYPIIRIPAVLCFLPKLFFFSRSPTSFGISVHARERWMQHGANGKF